jgi:cell division protein FtsW (lipid II flippase)
LSVPAGSPRRASWLIVEIGLLLVAIGLCWWLGGRATDAWLARTAALEAATVPAASAVRGLARAANLYFSLGVMFLAAARVVSWRRGRDPVAVPWLLPSMVLASLLGLLLHHATVDSALRGGVLVVTTPSASGFAQGFLLGAIAGAAILVAPVDLAAAASRWRVPIAIAMAAIFAALAVAGTGPGESGTRINLGPVQPIEAVKPLFVMFLAGYLGARAPKLRWQRQRILGLRWPRPKLLVPAIAALVGIFLGLFLVGDLGPVMILALVFLGMFYMVSRATGWAAVAIALVAALLALVSKWPGLVDVGRIATRLRMWHDPWWNGMTHGHQLGESLWSIAAGGFWGQGLAGAHTPLAPAAKTDLALATLVEQLGAVGLLAYLLCLAAMVASGFHIASKSRTPERVLLAGGATLLLLVQWAIIHAGTVGALPLTGIVVPFVSAGRSSMVAFVAITAMLARLAEDARARVLSAELDEIQKGARATAAVGLVVILVGALSGFYTAVLDGERVSAMGIVTRLSDGTIVHRQNPRLIELIKRIRRGTIEDRHGEPLARSDAGARREYPLGAALGTLMGVHPAKIYLPPSVLERAFDSKLRGYGERADGPRDARGTRLPWPDLRQFAPLLSLGRAERLRRAQALDANVAARSVRLSIDAGLQRDLANLLGKRVGAGRHLAAAVVVLDVDTGQVLARVQAPDYDPNDARWQERLAQGDPRFTGAYGEWPDKTGLQGMYQAGSVAKLFTALAAARRGWGVEGDGCAARADVRFACTEADAQGPFFMAKGWPKPIHDHAEDSPHGELEAARALAVSCNVYFAQLGLRLGPEPLVDLWNAGVDVGYGRARGFDPGAAGTRQLASSAFGQGAMVMNAVQAARLVAAVGAGGVYRRCPPSMELDAKCSETALVTEPRTLAPVLAGMHLTMTAGTGRPLKVPAGLRVYGKTGTADVQGFAGEAAFGIAAAEKAAPHSWFVALAEPSTIPECQLSARGRIAVAVVVPRGGSGAAAAGPIAMDVIAAVQARGYLGGSR